MLQEYKLKNSQIKNFIEKTIEIINYEYVLNLPHNF